MHIFEKMAGDIHVQNYEQNWENFTVCVSSFQESLFVRNPEPKLSHFDNFSPLNAAFNS
jgi:hypothetical protein